MLTISNRRSHNYELIMRLSKMKVLNTNNKISYKNFGTTTFKIDFSNSSKSRDWVLCLVTIQCNYILHWLEQMREFFSTGLWNQIAVSFVHAIILFISADNMSLFHYFLCQNHLSNYPH